MCISNHSDFLFHLFWPLTGCSIWKIQKKLCFKIILDIIEFYLSLFFPELLLLQNIILLFQTYAADVFFAQEWKDHRLILPENMTREYRLLPVEWLHLIWRPDSFFKNAKKVTFQTMTIPNHYVWLYKDRTILYMVK